MTTKFNMTRDINGYNGFGVTFADDARSATLTVGVAHTVTIPSNFQNWLAIFSFEPGAKVWVANNTTAAVPVAATFGTTASELNPTARQVKAADVLSFITANTTADVGVTLYALS